VKKKKTAPPEWKLWREHVPTCPAGTPFWDHLREIALEQGIDAEHIPQKWTYEAEKALYMAIGHAVVCRQIEPRLRKERDLALGLKPKHPGGRKKGSRSNVKPIESDEANAKRRQRAAFPFGTDKISDREWYRRFDGHYAKKSPRT
jgi:hypothetical protein